jgi:5-methylcytosine-specific restriction endonuclease McrBC regulatory subunit McrC
MNFYYERLVDFVLKQLLEDRTNRKLLFQTKVHFLNNQIRNLQIVDNDEIYQGYFKLRPDIVVCDEKDRVRCIIDSKYKAQSDNGDLKIRAQDIVQMVGYWQHYQQSDGVSAKLLLIHPRVTATKATSNLFSQDGYVTLSAPRKDDLKIRVRIISMHIDNALQLVRSRKSKAA